MPTRSSKDAARVITLLTDFGLGEEYVGVMKGVILGIHPKAQVVDLCHEVPAGDLERAGRLLAWAWRYFPRGTVHVVVVDPGVGSSRKVLCAEREGHRFLAPDNGVLSWVLQGADSVPVRWVREKRYFLPKVSRTFHGRDIFAPVAAHLSRGLSPGRLGPILPSFTRLPVEKPRRLGRRSLEGKIIQHDRFGSAVTDLPADLLRSLGPWTNLRVLVKGRSLNGIRDSYAERRPGSPLAILGSRDLLEIAVNQGSARRLLKLRVGDRVEVRRR